LARRASLEAKIREMSPIAPIVLNLYLLIIAGSSKRDSWEVPAFFLSSIYLAGSVLYRSLSIKNYTEPTHFNFFTKLGLFFFKVIVGTRVRSFWFMSALYFAGVFLLILPKEVKPAWGWWVGGGTTILYLIYSLWITVRPLLRPDPHPPGIDSPNPPEVLDQTVETLVGPESRTTQLEIPEGLLLQTSNATLLRLEGSRWVVVENPEIKSNASEPQEPESRFTRMLRDHYPL
jgi:uncharacterized membrane protein